MAIGRQAAGTPIRVVNAWAPIRVCDNGGWTDTWFARHGKVFNMAVTPGVDVQVTAYRRDERPEAVVLHPADLGPPYALDLAGAGAGPHPLLEAAIAEIGIPADVAVEIWIHSGVPPGCSAGTSAAVVVALVGALDVLRAGSLTPVEVARVAHRIEVERLGLQSGVQDQLAAACGGINFIEIEEYPRARVWPVEVPDAVWWELDRRLVLVYLGRTHHSSAVHERVITSLAGSGGAAPALDALRQAAERSRAAVVAGDFAALGRAMIDNTAAQGDLHPDLIGRETRELITLVSSHEVLGWKVNGAGGQGGSVTLLGGPSARARRDLLRTLAETLPHCRVIPTSLSRAGLCVWDAPLT